MNRNRALFVATLVLLALLGWWFLRADDGKAPPGEAPPTAAPETVSEPSASEAPPPRARAQSLTPSRVEEVAADSSGAFAGRVLSARTGEGVPGATLTFEGSGVAFTTQTTAGGTFEFKGQRPGTYRLAEITAPGFLPFGPEWGHSPVVLEAIAGKRVEGLAFFLAPATALYGVVLSPDGGTVTDATVRITSDEGTLGAQGPITSGADGEFEFHAPEGAELLATHPAFGPGRATVGPRAVLGERVRVRLAPPGTVEPTAVIAGRVITADGSPAPETLIEANRRRRLEERFNDDTDPPLARTTADAEGRFRLEGLRPGRYDLRAYLPGVGRGGALAVDAPREDLTITLARGAKIRGSVRGADGQVVAAFTVDLQRMRGSLGRDAFITTSVIRSDGEFELEGVGPGKYALQVAAHGHAVSEEREVVIADPPADVGPVNVRLERGGSVSGVVRSEATRKPLPGAIVSLEGGVQSSSSALPVTASTTTDSAGHFELSGLAEGLRSITVMAQGHHGRVMSGLAVKNDGSIGPVEVSLNPVKEGEEPSIELVGIGAVLTPKGETLLVGRVIAGGGAAEAGITEGDELLQIDGVRISALGFEGAVNRIRGPENSTLAVTLQRKGEPKPRELVVRRKRIRS